MSTSSNTRHATSSAAWSVPPSGSATGPAPASWIAALLRALLVAVLAVHGLIHLLGVIEGYGLSDVALSQPARSLVTPPSVLRCVTPPQVGPV